MIHNQVRCKDLYAFSCIIRKRCKPFWFSFKAYWKI